MYIMKKTVFILLIFTIALFAEGNSNTPEEDVVKAVQKFYSAMKSGNWNEIMAVGTQDDQEKSKSFCKTKEEKTKLAKIFQSAFQDIELLNCKDVVINGENATLSVTINKYNKEETLELKLIKENGIWFIEG